MDEHATVIVSDEGSSSEDSLCDAQSFDIHPAYVHDALAEAELLVADTQTMVTEAAMLGTPAVRSNSFVGESDMSNSIELENERLIHNTTEFNELLGRATQLLTDEAIKNRWDRHHDSFIRNLLNLIEFLVDIARAPDPVVHLDE